ncbi:MAG TPA: hypothetical protein DDW54_01930, partial [Clostridiales bacterium]|nr:hypothetical protein [Clostridiales bacterium]
MKLETNVKNLDADIIEELKFVTDCDGLNVVVSHREEGYSFFDNVTVNGRDYSFSAEKRYKGETERKRYEKRYVKLAVYKAVSDYTGEKLTWGALTGIRPVKYAYSVGERWREELKEEMEVEDGKLDLVGRIIEQQKGIYGYKEGNVDLFIGVPFCPSRCLYCSFISNEIGRETAVSEYCDCVVKEIKAAMPLIKNLRSVYIGGGTPVSLPVKELEKILDAVGKVGCEFPVEAG